MNSVYGNLKVKKKIFIDTFGPEFIEYAEKTFAPTENPVDSFWEFLSSLEDGIKSFDNQLKILQFLCETGEPTTFTFKRIELIEQYFLEYHNINLEQFNSPQGLFEYDSNAIEYSLSIFTVLQDEESIESLSNFLIAVVQKSVIEFTEIIPFYIETIKKQLWGPNTNVLLNFLVKFIDAIEGRIDESRYGYSIFKYPKKRRNLRIFIGEEAIDLVIHPTKTSLYSIRNAISAIKEIPFDSFNFDVDEINDTVKSINLIENETIQMGPSKFKCFPSCLLSEDAAFVQLAFTGLHEFGLSNILLKILHRMKIPDYEKNVNFFINPLSEPEIAPANYQYLTEYIFFHLMGCRNIYPSFDLQKNLKKDKKQFMPILPILLTNLVENKFQICYQISSIEILRLFIDFVFINPDQLFNLLNQFFADTKCQGVLFLLAQFLNEKKFSIDIPNKRLLKNIVLQSNQTNFKAIKTLMRQMNGINFYKDLILEILTNPIQFITISPFISKITEISLIKYPSIADSVLKLSADELAKNPCQIVCDLLKEVFKVQNFDAIDLLSEFFRVSLENVDLPLKKSILRFLLLIPDSYDIKMSTIMSILDQDFHIGNFNAETFEPPARYFNGLSNSGNTCYINSILQQLNSIDPFYETFIGDSTDNLRPDIQYLKILFSMMRYNSDDVSINSEEYCNLYQETNPDFDVHQQQDADEFLLQLFDFIPSECLKIFEGKITNIIQNVSGRPMEQKSDEIFLTLPISLTNDSDLQSSIQRYLKRSPVYDDEGRIVAHRQIEFKKLPPVLIFHLHRFNYSVELQQKVKINSYLSFPTALNMDEFVENDERKEFGIYHLKGAVIHSGSAIGGHYMSVIKCNFKNSPDESNEDHWLLFNDDTVTGINETDFFEMGFGDVEEGCQSAYLLFYERE